MITTNQKYTPVLKHRSIQVILPYELFEVTDNNTSEVLWYEVTHAHPKTFEEYGRRVFPKESLAREFIVNQLTISNNANGSTH